MRRTAPDRREALTAFVTWLGSSPCLRADRGTPPRIAPPDELANVTEFEDAARRKLGAAAFARIADGDRGALDRITFRPRMMVSTMGLDLSLDLLGQTMFAPILVGPASRQHQVYPEGEAATATGAAAARALIVTAEESGTPLAETARAAQPCWRQFYPDADVDHLLARIAEARRGGCTAACLTVGEAGARERLAGYGWERIERLCGLAGLPLVLKGIMHPDDAAEAAKRGVEAIVVSTHGARRRAGTADPITALPAIAEAVAGRIPILIDGGIRRGGDVLKALALGATAALVCRPALWGLAAYGAHGVRQVIELLQTELARDMVQLGAETLRDIRRDHVRVHRRR